MTTPSTAVAMTDSPAVGTLPAAIQQQLELRKLSNQIAGKLAEMNWGKALDLATRRAVADWGRQFRVDVTTEIDVLGANIYLNARYYLRRLAEMIESGVVEYAYADHIETDPRLDQLGEEGAVESRRRLMQRIMHQAPDKAASVVAFRVKLRNMDREAVGVKWCGGGTRQSDPVGDKFPVEASESRAARRVMRQIASHVPKVSEEIAAIEDAADLVGEQIGTAKADFDKMERVAAIEPKAITAPTNPAMDPYGLDDGPAPFDDDAAELGL